MQIYRTLAIATGETRTSGKSWIETGSLKN